MGQNLRMKFLFSQKENYNDNNNSNSCKKNAAKQTKQKTDHLTLSSPRIILDKLNCFLTSEEVGSVSCFDSHGFSLVH